MQIICSYGSVCLSFKNDAQYLHVVNEYNLLLYPAKTQLVWFSLSLLPCSSPNSPTLPTFLFAGQCLKLADRACHPRHILRSNLSDTDDIQMFKSRLGKYHAEGWGTSALLHFWIMIYGIWGYLFSQNQMHWCTSLVFTPLQIIASRWVHDIWYTLAGKKSFCAIVLDEIVRDDLWYINPEIGVAIPLKG